MARKNRLRRSAEQQALRCFPIEEDLAYKCVRGKKVRAAGSGKTLEISSGAITFTTQHELQPRQRVEIAVNWPAMIDTCLMKLVINGRVVHSAADRATVAIEHYEFRTRASSPLPAMSQLQASTVGAD